MYVYNIVFFATISANKPVIVIYYYKKVNNGRSVFPGVVLLTLTCWWKLPLTQFLKYLRCASQSE